MPSSSVTDGPPEAYADLPNVRSVQSIVVEQRIRDEIWKMEHCEDMAGLMRAVSTGLRELGVDIIACGVNLIEQKAEQWQVRIYTYWKNSRSKSMQVSLGRINAETPVLVKMWQDGSVVYRPDLDAEDRFGESLWINQSDEYQIRAVIDVPFVYGTLALSSQTPKAFSAKDIAVAERMAAMLSEGFSRREDLQKLENEIAECQRSEQEHLRRNEALELLATGASLKVVLDAVTTGIETVYPVLRATILLLRGTCLYNGSSPSMPISYVEAIEGMKIVEGVGIFGTAVHTRQRVIFDDVAVHPDWAKSPIWAGRAELRACWSEPIISSLGEVLGVFAVYCEEPRSPLAAETKQIRSAAYLAGIAIQVHAEKEETKVSLAIQQVRNEALQMEDEADWRKASAVLNTQLATLVDFYLCGINNIDRPKNTYQSQDVTPPKAGKVVLNGSLPASLVQALQTGRYVYRRNRSEMKRYGDIIGEEANSVVDVPFRGGTIAVNSKVEEAFSERDIHILERFAQVVSEADLRLEDLKRLREKEDQLRQAQKMEAIGQLAAGIAHNFNNALSGAMVNLYMARRAVSPDVQSLLTETETAVQQATDMVRKLLTYSRQESHIEFRSQSIELIIGNVGAMCRKTFDRRIIVDIELDQTPLQVSGESTQLEQMLLNLCLNARDALQATQDPAIRIEAKRVDLDGGSNSAGPHVLLRVSDNGVGMDEETQVQIFDPFFTTKDVDSGSGLGLSTVYGIVQQHGGWIECESQLGQGAMFSVYLPAVEEKSLAVPAQSEGDVPSGVETVMIVDDEPQIRTSMERLLRMSGYQILLASDGLEALEIYQRHKEEIGLVILDISMPRMSGREALVEFRRLDPAVKVLVFSGYTPDAEDFYDQVMGVVDKPPNPEKILGQVRMCLDTAISGERS